MYQLTSQELLDINGGGTITASLIGRSTINAVTFIVNSIIKLFKW